MPTMSGISFQNIVDKTLCSIFLFAFMNICALHGYRTHCIFVLNEGITISNYLIFYLNINKPKTKDVDTVQHKSQFIC